MHSAEIIANGHWLRQGCAEHRVQNGGHTNVVNHLYVAEELVLQ